MVICLERDADLHMAQLMPLPLTLSCFSEIQIGFTFLLLSAHAGSAGKEPLNGRVCVPSFYGYNKSVFSYLRTLTTWHCPHSPAACCSSQSISSPEMELGHIL